MEQISLAMAFAGGLLSFLSPCVLPLVPVYVAILLGPASYQSGTVARVPSFFHSLSFISGFSIVFITIGAIAGLTGYAVDLSPVSLNRIAGSLLLALGVFMLLTLKISWLNYEKRLALPLKGNASYLRSLAIGACFCLGWTPCVAPVLGGILTLASVTATAGQGACLLAFYSLGFGLPFLVLGLAFDSITPVLRRIQRYSGMVYVASGLLLISIGVLVLTNKLGWLSSLAAQ